MTILSPSGAQLNVRNRRELISTAFPPGPFQSVAFILSIGASAKDTKDKRGGRRDGSDYVDGLIKATRHGLGVRDKSIISSACSAAGPLTFCPTMTRCQTCPPSCCS